MGVPGPAAGGGLMQPPGPNTKTGDSGSRSPGRRRRGIRRFGLALLSLAVVGIAAVVGGAAAWWLWLPSPLPAQFALETCRTVALVDRETSLPIVGVEDIAEVDGVLLLSAYDRRAAEAALTAGTRPPDGGIYRVSLAALRGDRDRHVLSSLVTARTVPGGLHPHGLDASGLEAGGTLFKVINRRLSDQGGARPSLIVGTLDGDGADLHHGQPTPQLCAANDPVMRPDGVVVTLDRRDCPGRSLRDALVPDGGRLLALTHGAAGDIRFLQEGLVFPNGLLVASEDTTAQTASAGADAARGSSLDLIVAETRARRLRGPGDRIWPLPGAPDNLTRDPGGGIVAALHSSLLRLAPYRFGWAETAPGRVVRVDATTGAVSVLFDDPRGDVFPAATVAVSTGDLLVAGSVRAPGLLVCREATTGRTRT